MVRFYYTHKRGETYSDIQDHIEIDESVQRYAVSDGVTNSFIPQVLSRILTTEFVSSGIANFPPPNLQEIFTIKREEYLNSLDEDQRFLQEMVEEEFQDSAATFVGVEIVGHLIRWKLIGDSCLFIQPDNGVLSCYCSNEVHMDSDNNLHVVFDSRPSRILSNGQTKGKIIEGELEISSGWIALASDAMSAWIIDSYNNKRNPFQLLCQLSDNEDFERFVDREYKEEYLKSDDESIILIRLDNQHEESPAPESSVYESCEDEHGPEELDGVEEPGKHNVSTEEDDGFTSCQSESGMENDSESQCSVNTGQTQSTKSHESPDSSMGDDVNEVCRSDQNKIFVFFLLGFIIGILFTVIVILCLGQGNRDREMILLEKPAIENKEK